MSFKKKSLGQHFLKDVDLAKKIAGSILLDETTNTKVIEIGPGQGALTKHLLDLPLHLSVIEKDDRFAEQIPQLFPVLSNRVIHDDVLKINWREVMKEKPVVAGNFPYNISNLILFKIFENRDLVPQMVGMFQKEVAERIASKGKNKAYGKLSVLLQSYYDVTYDQERNSFEFREHKIVYFNSKSSFWAKEKKAFQQLEVFSVYC